jgi:putative protein-disulfide isomerase
VLVVLWLRQGNDRADGHAPGLDLEIIVGGVRAGATDVLDQAGKEFRLGHWARVEAQSGLPFNRAALMARENFVYNTEPICRAVVAARKLAPQADLLAVFRALQHAFYVDGLDTTNGRVLAEVVARQLQLDVETVLRTWEDRHHRANQGRLRARPCAGRAQLPGAAARYRHGIIEISGGYAHAAQLHQQLQKALGHAA